MAKYRLKRTIKVPDGKDDKGRVKIKVYEEGEIYDLSDAFIDEHPGPAGKVVYIPIKESKKSKTEKKPDVRTR